MPRCVAKSHSLGLSLYPVIILFFCDDVVENSSQLVTYCSRDVLSAYIDILDCFYLPYSLSYY